MKTGNYKYFYDVFGYICEADDDGLVVASEKPIKQSKIKGCSKKMFTRLKDSEITINAKVNIIFGDPRSTNGMKKLSRRGTNLPEFIKKRSNKNDFAVYEFLSGEKAALDENWVCEKK